MKGTCTSSTKFLDNLPLSPDEYKIYGRTRVECKIIKFRIVE